MHFLMEPQWRPNKKMHKNSTLTGPHVGPVLVLDLSIFDIVRPRP